MKMYEKNIVYLSLGSNSENAILMLHKALEKIGTLPHCKILLVSPLFWTEPQGYACQPWFANIAVKAVLDILWNPNDFLKLLLQIENSLGRKRDPEMRFGPRTIDIDLLLFGNIKSSNQNCILPHPRMCQRAFVLVPLLVIEPALKIEGHSLPQLLEKLSWRLAGQKIFQ